MIRNKSHKIFSLLMATLIFTSSLGYQLDVHYCGGEFFDFSLLGVLETCQKPDNEPEKSKAVNKSCCDFDQFKVETSSNFDKSSTDIPSTNLSINAYFIAELSDLKLDSFKILGNYALESPPEIKTNKLYKRVQSFLI